MLNIVLLQYIFFQKYVQFIECYCRMLFSTCIKIVYYGFIKRLFCKSISTYTYIIFLTLCVMGNWVNQNIDCIHLASLIIAKRSGFINFFKAAPTCCFIHCHCIKLICLKCFRIQVGKLGSDCAHNVGNSELSP